MATATIEVRYTPGQTLTLDLFPRGSDTAAASAISLTERTNAKGIYRGTTTAGLTGWHTAHVKLSGTVVAVLDVLMSDTATDHYAADGDPEQVYGVHGAGAIAGVDWSRISNASSTVNLSATTVNLTNTATTLTNAPSDSSGVTTLLSRIGGAITITDGRVNAGLTHVLSAAVDASLAQIGVNVVNIGGTAQTAKDLGAINVTNLNTLSGHDPGATLGTSTLDAAGVRTAVGLSAANLDTQLTAIDDYLDTEVAAIIARLPIRVTKNTALAGFTFPLFSSSDHATPTTGLTVTAQRSLDGAAFAACANAVTEIGSGVYRIDLAAGDTNANVIILKFSASGADTQFATIVTQP